MRTCTAARSGRRSPELDALDDRILHHLADQRGENASERRSEVALRDLPPRSPGAMTRVADTRTGPRVSLSQRWLAMRSSASTNTDFYRPASYERMVAPDQALRRTQRRLSLLAERGLLAHVIQTAASRTGPTRLWHITDPGAGRGRGEPRSDRDTPQGPDRGTGRRALGATHARGQPDRTPRSYVPPVSVGMRM